MARDSHRFVHLVAAFAVAVIWSGIARAENVDPDLVWEMLSAGLCGQARARVNAADNVGDFLASPEGQSLYGKSLGCSSTQELIERDIDEATRHLAAARAGFRPLSGQLERWFDDAEAQCELTRVALAGDSLDEPERLRERENRIEVFSS